MTERASISNSLPILFHGCYFRCGCHRSNCCGAHGTLLPAILRWQNAPTAAELRALQFTSVDFGFFFDEHIIELREEVRRGPSRIVSVISEPTRDPNDDARIALTNRGADFAHKLFDCLAYSGARPDKKAECTPFWNADERTSLSGGAQNQPRGGALKPAI